MGLETHFGYCDNLYFKLLAIEPHSVFYHFYDNAPRVTFQYKRKKRQRYPKWDTGMWCSCSYDYPEPDVMIMNFENYWSAN